MVCMSYSSAFLSSKHFSTQWYIDIYGALDNQSPIFIKANKIFKLVFAAADKKNNYLPKLIVLNKLDDLMAMAQTDGCILITKKTIDFCYNELTEDSTEGDTRLAFIFGHELAHLAKNDFWASEAYKIVLKFADNQDIEKKLINILIKTEDVKNDELAKKVRVKKELQADQYAMIYTTMAGFQPKYLKGDRFVKFLHKWNGHISKSFVDDNHPTPNARVEFIRSYMKDISQNINIFHVGVRLLQTNHYDDALAFFKWFRLKFPGREVFNNIGVIHYEKALKLMIECNPDHLYPFMLSSMIETKTRASNIRFKGYCKKKEVDNQLKKAIVQFKLSINKDPLYIPAYINLSSAYILKEQYSNSLATLDNALEMIDKNISNNDNYVGLTNNRAITIYFLGKSLGMDMFQNAVDILEKTSKYAPISSYNLGRMYFDRKRHELAKKNWKLYLLSGPEGDYAELVRKYLNEKQIISKAIQKDFYCDSPVKLGEFDNSLIQKVKLYNNFPLSDFIPGTFYENEDEKVLVLEDIVELVEHTIPNNITKSSVLSLNFFP